MDTIWSLLLSIHKIRFLYDITLERSSSKLYSNAITFPTKKTKLDKVLNFMRSGIASISMSVNVILDENRYSIMLLAKF
jgi:hypothetical protein